MDMVQLLAEYDVEPHHRLALIKVAVGVGVMVVAILVALAKAVSSPDHITEAKEKEMLKEFGGLSAEKLASVHAENPGTIKSCLNIIILIGVLICGRNAYEFYQDPGKEGLVEFIATILLFTVIPAMTMRLLLRNPDQASSRTIVVCLWLAATIACLLLLWAVLNLAAVSWQAAIVPGIMFLMFFVFAGALSTQRNLRLYNKFLAVENGPQPVNYKPDPHPNEQH